MAIEPLPLEEGAPPPFSKLLRERTNRKRTATQAISNLTVPLALGSPRVYLVLLRAYQHIFNAFEDEFEKRRRIYPRLNRVYFTELLRRDAFELDVAFYRKLARAAPGDRPLRVLPAAERFVSEMRAALAKEPVLVIAYSYALYVGLFTASPRVAPWVREAFELDQHSESGVAIWHFTRTIKNLKGFRKALDTAWDEFAMSDAERERVFAHVLCVLDSSARVFQQVKATEEYASSVSGGLLRALVGVAVLAYVVWTWERAFRWAVGLVEL